MPEHGAMPHSTVIQTESPAPSCALASVCAPSTLAIVSLPASLESVIPLYPAAEITETAILSGIASASPFHPPRA